MHQIAGQQPPPLAISDLWATEAQWLDQIGHLKNNAGNTNNQGKPVGAMYSCELKFVTGGMFRWQGTHSVLFYQYSNRRHECSRYNDWQFYYGGTANSEADSSSSACRVISRHQVQVWSQKSE